MSSKDDVFYPHLLDPDCSGHISKENANEFMDKLADQLGTLTPDTLPDGELWVGNANAIAQAVALSGDATLDNTGNLTVVSVGGESAGNVANAISTVNSIEQDYMTLFLDDGEIWVGNPGNSAVGVPLSGDATLDNTGDLTVVSVGGANAANIGFCANVTSDIQDQLDGISGLGVANITSSTLSGNDDRSNVALTNTSCNVIITTTVANSTVWVEFAGESLGTSGTFPRTTTGYRLDGDAAVLMSSCLQPGGTVDDAGEGRNINWLTPVVIASPGVHTITLVHGESAAGGNSRLLGATAGIVAKLSVTQF